MWKMVQWEVKILKYWIEPASLVNFFYFFILERKWLIFVMTLDSTRSLQILTVTEYICGMEMRKASIAIKDDWKFAHCFSCSFWITLNRVMFSSATFAPISGCNSVANELQRFEVHLSHLYERVCVSVRRCVGRLVHWSFCWSIMFSNIWLKIIISIFAFIESF